MPVPVDSTPSLTALLKGSWAKFMEDFFVCFPGRVESYSNGRADVHILIKRPYVDESGTQQARSYPVVVDAPVMFPGSGGVRVKFPVSVGDTVLVLFASASLDRWLALDREVDPLDNRRGKLSDGIVIPGLDASYSEGSPLIEFTSSEVKAGGSQSLALKSDVEALKSAIAGAGSGDAIPGAMAGVTITGTTVLKGS